MSRKASMLANAGTVRSAREATVRNQFLVMMMGRRNRAGVDSKRNRAQNQQHENRNGNACRPAHGSPVGIDSFLPAPGGQSKDRSRWRRQAGRCMRKRWQV